MELSTSKCGNYRIELVNRDNFHGALEVIRESFCADEAACVGCEVRLSAAAGAELLELCADAALDGVSLAAVCAASGRVAAVAFNKLQVSTSEHEESFFEKFTRERCKQPSAKSLIQFMASVDAECNLFEKYNVDCSLELMFLATLKEHRRKHLASLLVRDSLTLAKKLQDGPVTIVTVQDLGVKYSHIPCREVTEKKPKICQAIFTSTASQKLGKSENFTVDISIPYDKFEYNGKTFADRIGPESPVCQLMSKPVEI